ncbi:hypothetical protein B0H14DRAFT_3102425 [Mycena olivaceomarginata]|nr:hypothetical protein B0H14DRAFT_3102425 [Mycena olivaceomarginata]
MGSGRGSFIWGRSVHNTRIERPLKWKVFFLDLETNHGLNPTRSGLYGSFIISSSASVIGDAQDWAEAWNSHQLTVRRQRERSPAGLGPRGISAFLTPEEGGRLTANPFALASTPVNLSEVLCHPPGCPFTPAQLLRLDEQLSASVTCCSRKYECT